MIHINKRERERFLSIVLIVNNIQSCYYCCELWAVMCFVKKYCLALGNIAISMLLFYERAIT